MGSIPLKKAAWMLVLLFWAGAGKILSADFTDIPLIGREEAPVIDGAIRPGEWSKSLCTTGFVQLFDGLLLSGKEGYVYLCADDENLYVAVRSMAKNNDPGGGLTSAARQRDGDVYSDDSIELVLQSDSDSNTAYHIIANSSGVVFDRRFTRVPHSFDLTWDCPGLRIGSEAKSGWWEIEFRIPRKSIGSPSEKIRMNIGRNWSGTGASALNSTSNYFHPSTLLEFNLRKETPAVQIVRTGNIQDGFWSPEIRVGFLPPGKKIRVDAVLKEHAARNDSGQILKLASGTFSKPGTLSFEYGVNGRNLYSLEVTARDCADGRMFFHRCFYAKRGSTSGLIPPSHEFDLKEFGFGQCFQYPSMNSARLNLAVPGNRKVRSVTALCAGKSDPLSKKNGDWNGMIRTPPVAGRYPVSLCFEMEDGKRKIIENVLVLEKKTFPWQNNSFGKKEIILPPFKGIVRKNNALEVILRRYEFGGDGLLKSLQCLGREMLAEPMHYELRVGGKNYRLEGKVPAITVRGDGYCAEIESKAVSPEGMALTSRGRLEYDGFYWNELCLENVAGKVVEKLTLVIPLEDAEAPLFHVIAADTIRRNPSGKVPGGQGTVWDGTLLHRPTLKGELTVLPQFVPYVWLGAEKRGLSLFFQDSYGMKLSEKDPAVRIVRRQGKLFLEADFINRPVRLGNGHRLAFGLHATPVKTYRGEWREYFQTYFSNALPDMKKICVIHAPAMGFANTWERRPYKDDWDLYRFVVRQYKTGRDIGIENEVMKWDDRHKNQVSKEYSDLPDVGRESYVRWYFSCRKSYIHDAKILQGPALPVRYSDPSLSGYKDEGVQYFKSEWISQPSHYIGASRMFYVPSYMDYILAVYRDELNAGLEGLYFDDMFFFTCRNPDTAAKVDEEGILHAQTGLLQMRELVKRAAVMQYEKGLNPRFLQVHMTNALIVPVFSFATSTLDWEDHYGEEVFQKRFPDDFVRAESLGTQIGTEGVVLDGIVRNKIDKKTWDGGTFEQLTRSALSVMLPHDLKPWLRMPPDAGMHRPTLYRTYAILAAFRIWEPDCKYVPYYETDGAIAGVPEGVTFATYRRPGKVLLIFGNSGEEKHFAFTADAKKLGLAPGTRFCNAETGEECPGGRVRLGKNDFMILTAGIRIPVPPFQNRP